MSASSVSDILTVVEHATWVVDHAVIPPRRVVDDNGTVTALGEQGPGQLAVQAIEERIRPDKRGVRREGLTVRLFMILLIVAAWHRRVWVRDLYTIATGLLPVEVQRELGILYFSNRHGKTQLREITGKQLYGMVDAFRRHLDVDPAFGLSAEQEADRLAFLDDVKDAFLYATHVLPLTGASVAIDETGVWSWMRGPQKPKGLPLVDPSDEDKTAAESIHRPVEAAVDAVRNAKVQPVDPVETLDIRAGEPAADDFVDDDLIDEDLDTEADAPATPGEPDPGSSPTSPASTPRLESGDKPTKAGKRCWFASWGVKTHKTGKRSAYFGSSLHALINVPRVSGGSERAEKKLRYQEPLLMEEFAVTPPSKDVVAPSLELVKKMIARGRRVDDLLGDRHYSYKKFDRWAAKLWQLRVRPVLDLRENDHGAHYYNGAVIIAGTPHLDPPQHLRKLPRPGKGAPKIEMSQFAAKIAERQRYAFKRHKTAWSRNDGKPGGDGITRWVSPVRAGTVGCPHDPVSVEVARETGQPILDPNGHDPELCLGSALWIQPGPHMKYHQEHYWGSPQWLRSWNRRTYVEAAFGNMKNYATGNIHRGFMQFTGRALITIGLTAAVVAYNLRELENWHARASKHCPDNPLLDIYGAHPLHQRTKWVHGFCMLTREARDQRELEWLDELTSRDDDSDLAAAA